MSAPRLVSPADTTWTPRFAHGDQAKVAAVSGSGDGTPLGTGFVQMTAARIPWTIRYDEVVLVLEGELSIHADGRTLTARTHQAIWMPAGTDVVYEAEEALVFYAIHPADWATQGTHEDPGESS